MVTEFRVSWDKQALLQLRDAYEYIRQESPKYAGKVRSDILALTASLSTAPFRYPPDALRTDRDPQFRATELHSYRIAYYVDEVEGQIIVVRVRHARREPLTY